MDEDIVYSMIERHSGKASQPTTTRSFTTSSLRIKLEGHGWNLSMTFYIIHNGNIFEGIKSLSHWGVKMTGNNHRCPCGSGKKYKKCCKDKKNTNKVTTITFDMNEEIAIDGYEIGANGTICLKKEGKTIIPMQTNFSQFNKRENKKDKVTLKAPVIDQENLSMNIAGIIDRFDYVFIIDTNTLTNPDEKSMISASIMMHYQKNDSGFILKDTRSNTFKHNNNIHGEKIGLVELIKYIINILEISAEEAIGIVTDHDLGDHEKYNSGEIPLIFGTNLYLPPNIKLIYSSADKKNENFLNQLINKCDKEASRLLKP